MVILFADRCLSHAPDSLVRNGLNFKYLSWFLKPKLALVRLPLEYLKLLTNLFWHLGTTLSSLMHNLGLNLHLLVDHERLLTFTTGFLLLLRDAV